MSLRSELSCCLMDKNTLREGYFNDVRNFYFILYPVNFVQAKQSKARSFVPYRTFSIAKHFHTICKSEQGKRNKATSGERETSTTETWRGSFFFGSQAALPFVYHTFPPWKKNNIKEGSKKNLQYLYHYSNKSEKMFHSILCWTILNHRDNNRNIYYFLSANATTEGR